ncbi:jg25898, partial [Pararge aegeria aegeria]
MDTLKLRVIMEYELRRGTNATQTARNIKNENGENCTNDHTTRPENFDLKNEARGRPENLVNNNESKAIVEANETECYVHCLVFSCGSHGTAIRGAEPDSSGSQKCQEAGAARDTNPLRAGGER